MTTGRLTRQELGWLLAQEARGAAKMLRKDVTLLTQPPPADPAVTSQTPDLRVETTLNALDGAIDLLSELEAGPATSKRRGRIDLVALLMELAPSANLSFEPGAGTEVAGDEAEFRRMFHLLVGQASSAAGGGKDAVSAVQVRREGDWVRVTADLGPDVSASSELERRWLSRMAVRLGGHLDLEGGKMSLVLPADASNENETADLRKELEQAQQLGEAYARELAAVFAAGQLPEVDAASDRRDVATRRFELMVSIASAVHRALNPLARGLKEFAERTPQRSPIEGLVALTVDLSSELGRAAQCPISETSSRIDIGRVVRDAAAEVDAHAARRGVRVDIDVPEGISISTKAKALALLVHSLLDHAVLATPTGGRVALSVRAEAGSATLMVSDGGPPIPPPAHADLLEHRADPTAFGRPTGPSLVIAHTTAAHLGTRLRLGEGTDGASIAEVVLEGA